MSSYDSFLYVIYADIYIRVGIGIHVDVIITDTLYSSVSDLHIRDKGGLIILMRMKVVLPSNFVHIICLSVKIMYSTSTFSFL